MTNACDHWGQTSFHLGEFRCKACGRVATLSLIGLVWHRPRQVITMDDLERLRATAGGTI